MKVITFFAVFLCCFDLIGQDRMTLDSLKKYIASHEENISGLSSNVDISVSESSLKEFLRAIATTHNINISLERVPDRRISNNFNAVSVSELLAFVCHSYRLGISFLNNIIVIYSVPKIKELFVGYDIKKDLLSFSLRGDTLSDFAKNIADTSAYNVILSHEIRDRTVYGYIDKMPFVEAMKQFAVSNDLVLEMPSKKVLLLSANKPAIEDPSDYSSNDNRYNKSSRSSRASSSSRNRRNRNSSEASISITKNRLNQENLDVLVSEISIVEAIKMACKELEADYYFMQEPEGMLDCRLIDVSMSDFMVTCLTQLNFTFTMKDGVYIIGDTKNTNLHKTQVYRLKNRAVEEILKVVPNTYLEGLDVKEYPDLNALIITGSGQRIARILQFLEQIDKPIPNVLIEVMVVVINKGSSLEAGMSAGIIKDSTNNTASSTNSTVFPGLDVTADAVAINDLLGSLDRKGVVNLGRVGPNFYAKIQALEQGSFLDMQSTPKLSTVNGHEASLVIGNSEYYLIETQNVTGGVNPIITTTPRYEKVEANLELKVKPFVSYNEDVVMNIQFESSDFLEPRVVGAPPGNSTRKFDSKIRIKNEEMIVIGGLESESTTEATRGLPGIAKWPVFKWFFGNNLKSEVENKLIVFIKPTIVY